MAGEQEAFPVEVMLGFYSVTVAIIGVVLIAATVPWGRARRPEEPAGAPIEESARQR